MTRWENAARYSRSKLLGELNMSENHLRLPDGLDLETAESVLREYAQTDDAQIVSEGTVDALETEVQEFKAVFAELLAEESPQSADTLARQDAEALTEPYRNDDGDIEVDTLRQTPETGDPDDPDGGSDPSDPDLDALSGTEQRRIVEVLQPKRRSFRQRGMDESADAIETEILELTGYDEYDDVEPELETLAQDIRADELGA